MKSFHFLISFEKFFLAPFFYAFFFFSFYRTPDPQWTHLRRFAIDPTSKFHVESSSKLNQFWKVNPCGNYDIDLTWKFRRGFTFKIDKISITSPRGFFYVVSTSNRRNFCTRCFHCIIL